MTRPIATYVMFLLALLVLASEARPAETPVRVLQWVGPQYDRRAADAGREGWVYIRARIDAAGVMHDPVVFNSYPKGMFDDEALRAVTRWKFAPKTVDGIAVEDPAYRVGIVFADFNNSGISDRAAGMFRAALKAFRENDIAAAEVQIGRIKERFEKELLNMSEVVRLAQMEGSLAMAKGDYVKALEEFEFLIDFSEYADNREMVDTAHMQTVVAFLGVGQFDNAVDYYDSWRARSEFKVPSQLADRIGELKQSGRGKGRVFAIGTYRENLRDANLKALEAGRRRSVDPNAEKK